MTRFLSLWILLSLCAAAVAGNAANYVERLEKSGRHIPQEKVFVHLDNTSFFMGDTIWYAAYLRETATGRPSAVSRVLYVELLDNDGYLVERQMLWMDNGFGHGQFALDKPLMYAGHYELRAYTRWQLNWGLFQHPHSRVSRQWFSSPALEERYYRDYEKLYSRVFPVYDRPADSTAWPRHMTLRPPLRGPCLATWARCGPSCPPHGEARRATSPPAVAPPPCGGSSTTARSRPPTLSTPANTSTRDTWAAATTPSAR